MKHVGRTSFVLFLLTSFTSQIKMTDEKTSVSDQINENRLSEDKNSGARQSELPLENNSVQDEKNVDRAAPRTQNQDVLAGDKSFDDKNEESLDKSLKGALKRNSRFTVKTVPKKDEKEKEKSDNSASSQPDIALGNNMLSGPSLVSLNSTNNLNSLVNVQIPGSVDSPQPQNNQGNLAPLDLMKAVLELNTQVCFLYLN